MDFVADGKNQPGPWEKLKSQIFLGSDEFVANLQCTLDAHASHQEIPAIQRRPPPKPLTQIAGAHGRDEAIFDAYASGGYSMKEIGDHFRLHYSRVSRILKEQRLSRGKA
jgi:putative transposase